MLVHSGAATMILFGQTSTGKTYTCFKLQDILAHDLFDNEGEAFHVGLSVFEIRGKKCYDLLADRRSLKILLDEHDQVHVGK